MAEQDGLPGYQELAKQFEPSDQETVQRLYSAYEILHRKAHEFHPEHTDQEFIWVMEHGPHLRGETRYRTGISVGQAGSITLIMPMFSEKKLFSGQLAVDVGTPQTDEQAVNNLVIATSIEELYRQIEAGTAWPEVQSNRR